MREKLDKINKLVTQLVIYFVEKEGIMTTDAIDAALIEIKQLSTQDPAHAIYKEIVEND